MAIPYQRIRRVLQHPRAIQVPMYRRRSPLSDLPTSYQLEEREFFAPALEHTIARVIASFGYDGVATAISTAFDLGWYAILNCAELSPVGLGADLPEWGIRPEADLLQEAHHRFLLNHAEELLNLSNLSEEFGEFRSERWRAFIDRSHETFLIESTLYMGDVEYPCLTLAQILTRTYQALATGFRRDQEYTSNVVEDTAEYLTLMLAGFGRLIFYVHRDTPWDDQDYIFDEPVVIRWMQRWYNEWLTRLAFIPPSN